MFRTSSTGQMFLFTCVNMGMGRPGPMASRPILGAMGRPISLDAMASMAHWVVWVDPNIFLQS